MIYDSSKFGLRKEVIDSIISLAKKYDIEKLYIFGSRARGDNGERSDIDLAVYGGNVIDFRYDVEEEVPTLLFFDVVDLNKKITDELREELERDGILIYEKV